VQPSYKRSRCGYSKMERADSANNVEGILMALRYLSVEAEGAGLTELAIALEDAAVQCGRYIARTANGFEGT
jgi:hypothetical protein